MTKSEIRQAIKEENIRLDLAIESGDIPKMISIGETISELYTLLRRGTK